MKLIHVVQQSVITYAINWVFGAIVFSFGIMNMLRGNDPIFGVAMIAASLIYFPPTYNLLRNVSGLSLHYILRIVIAFIIVWINLAIGAINEGYYPEITG